MKLRRAWLIGMVWLHVAPLWADAISAQQLSELRFASLWSSPEPKQTPHPSVVRVVATDRDGMSLGSGTLVDANDEYGLVITNWHVVRDAVGPIEVVFPDGFHSPARVVRTDREWDLASLLIWKPQAQPVPISTEAPRPGERLAIAGYGSGNYKMQSGACTQYLSPAPGKPLEIVELSAAARHGDSGGPILNSRGELAGVLFGEGGGRTDGSYGGRVHQFLQLTALDLQKLPATNVASTAAPTERRSESDMIARTAPAARFQGAVTASEDQPRPLYTVAGKHCAAGPSHAQCASRFQFPIRSARGETFDHSSVATANRPADGLHWFWLHWGGELKSFLAAFGVAAILLQLLRLTPKSS